MKIGDKLVATDFCIMEIINQPTLTIGKVYEIIDRKKINIHSIEHKIIETKTVETVISIIDDKNEEHWFSDDVFSHDHWSKHFKVGNIDERLS